MTIAQTLEPTARKPLRLWPGVIAVTLAAFAMFVLPLVAPAATMYGVIGGIVGGLLVLLWWLLFSRAPWLERLAAIALLVLAVIATRPIVDRSLSGAGMGMLFYMYAIPALSLALVVWAVATRRLDRGRRFAWLVAVILVACAFFLVLRVDGMSNTAGIDFEWRWSPTAEERLLAEVGDEPDPVPPAAAVAEPVPAAGEAAPAEADAAPMIADAAPVVDTSAVDTSVAPSVPPAAAKHEPEWPGFRGPHRDGIVHGVRIETDWSKSPPVELWRRAVGPGWSSFAVDGDRLLYAGAARRRGARLLLQGEDRRTGMEAPRRDPVLGSERRRRSARARRLSTTAASTPSVGPGSSTRSTPATAPSSGRATRRPTPARRSRTGASRAHRSWSTTWSSSPPPACSPGTTSPPASRGGRARRRAAATASPHVATIDGVTQVLLLDGTGRDQPRSRAAARSCGSTSGRATASCSPA